MTTPSASATQIAWFGSSPRCDLSPSHLLHGKFVDGATTLGPWGLMCMDCWAKYGRGLGVGKGQLYQLQPDKQWLLVAGGSDSNG